MFFDNLYFFKSCCLKFTLSLIFVPLFQESVDTSDGEDHDDEAVIHVPSGDSDFDFESDDSGSEEEQSK